MGIYEIRNLRNKKVYIGQSKNIENRLLDHKKLLRDGSHYNIHLQNSFNLYGECYFFFHVLEEIDNPVLLNEAENKWIGHYGSFAGVDGYNIEYPTKVFRLFYSMREERKRANKERKKHERSHRAKKAIEYTRKCRLPSCNKTFSTNIKNKYFCCKEHQKAYWKEMLGHEKGDIMLRISDQKKELERINEYLEFNKRFEKVEKKLGINK